MAEEIQREHEHEANEMCRRNIFFLHDGNRSMLRLRNDASMPNICLGTGVKIQEQFSSENTTE